MNWIDHVVGICSWIGLVLCLIYAWRQAFPKDCQANEQRLVLHSLLVCQLGNLDADIAVELHSLDAYCLHNELCDFLRLSRGSEEGKGGGLMDFKERLEKQMSCVHYRNNHYDDVRQEHSLGGCPHYRRGDCDLHENHPRVFPKKCLAN